MKSDAAYHQVGESSAPLTSAHNQQQQRTNSNVPTLSGAIAHLPLEFQVTFRRKVFVIFAIQLLLVAAIAATIAWIPSIHDPWASAINGNSFVLAMPIAATLVILLVLYYVRTSHPWNWVFLVLFSIALAFVYAGVDVIAGTNVGVLNCVALFVWTLLVAALSGIKHQLKATASHRGGGIGSESHTVLLSTFIAGMLSFVVVAAGEAVFFLLFGDSFVTIVGLVGSLMFQLGATLWFAHDANKMFRVMTPDEYMLGVINFYLDIVIAVLLLLAAVVAGEGGGHTTTVDNRHGEVSDNA